MKSTLVSQSSGTIFNKQTQILGYADDIDIIGRSQAAVREAFLAPEREANKIGSKIKESKTKYIIAVGYEITIRDVGQSVAFGEMNVYEIFSEKNHKFPMLRK
jgi:hypothetical protein